MNYKKAFTLVELLIVISIISMLGSIIIATTTSVQAKGRDAKRTQQIRQIDLATRLYIDTVGHAPYLNGCQVMTSGTPTSASGCVAVSTAAAGTPEAIAWTEFKNELINGGFIASVPDDPCASGCISALGSTIGVGYTYVAPLAVQYFCSQSGTCTASNDSYQVYAPLEQTVAVAGSSGSSAADYYFVNPPGGTDTTPPSVPTGVTAVMANNDQDIVVSWNPSTDTGSGVSGYEIDTPGLGGLITDTTRTLAVLGWMQGSQFCYPIVAIDVAGNRSGQSVPGCVTVPLPPTALQVPTGLSTTYSGIPGRYTLSWSHTVDPSIVGNRVYKIFKDGLASYTVVNSTSRLTTGWNPPFCWTVTAYVHDDNTQQDLYSDTSAQSCIP